MAHQAQADFFNKVKAEFPDHFTWSNVCEIGSLNINGTTRGLFTYANYVGFDVGLGPCVDYALPGEKVAYPDDSFDVVLSSECFEHAEGYQEIFDNMVRMTKPGGLVIFTCAGTGRPEHGTSRTDAGSSPLTVGLGIEYYKNLTPDDFDKSSLEGSDYIFIENAKDFDLYFVGVKHGKISREVANRITKSE